jgi:transposase-like protein
MERELSKKDYVYVWVDGIHTKVRLGRDERLCCLVMVGARIDGKKELVALQDGYRESEESWAELLRDLKKRGMRAPVLAVGDGALGFWKAVRDVFAETDHQRDWVHKTASALLNSSTVRRASLTSSAEISAPLNSSTESRALLTKRPRSRAVLAALPGPKTTKKRSPMTTSSSGPMPNIFC